MPQMVLYPNPDSITQFRCTHCDWVFYVQKPLTPEVPLELQKRYAEGWFAKHHCTSRTSHNASAQFASNTVFAAEGRV